MRYGKIVITADADVDGSHIRALFLTFIWKFAPQLIEDGYIYAAVPPLYKVTQGTKITYLKDDAALEEFKLDTCIEVAVGLPGNIRITHGVLHETYLAIEIAEIISISISVVTDSIVTLLTP